MIQMVVKSHNLDLVIKKDFDTNFFHIEEIKNVKKKEILLWKNMRFIVIKKTPCLTMFYNYYLMEVIILKTLIKQTVLLLMINQTIEAAFTSPIIMPYILIFVVCIKIFLIQANQELVISRNSNFEIIISTKCEVLLRNTFVIIIYVSIAKDLHSKRKKFFDFC